MINGHTTPIFVKNSHQHPFSIIPKANTYGFLTKKLSPPEIQECDLWQGNICGVGCTSLWSIIKGHTTPFLSKIAMNDAGFGDRRKAMLEDIAVLTGGVVISEEKGLKYICEPRGETKIMGFKEEK